MLLYKQSTYVLVLVPLDVLVGSSFVGMCFRTMVVRLTCCFIYYVVMSNFLSFCGEDFSIF